MGAEQERADGNRPHSASSAYSRRPVGGQHTLGLFGLPGTSRRHPVAAAARSQAPAPQAQAQGQGISPQEQEAPAAPMPGQGRLTQAVAASAKEEDAQASTLPPQTGALTHDAWNRGRVNFNAQCPAWSGDTGQRCELCEGHPLPHKYQGKLSQAVARAISNAPAPVPAAHQNKRDRSERLVVLDAMPRHGSAAPVQRATSPASASQAPDQGLTLTLRQGQFLAFVRLSAQEQRPVAQIVAEWKADCASLIGGADPYGDCPVHSLTDAMRLAQIASDERERFVPEDREEWGRPMSWGCTEIAMAVEG